MLNLPARAKDPCTLPPSSDTVRSNSQLVKAVIGSVEAKILPSHDSKKSSASTFSKTASFCCKKIRI